MKKKIIDGNTRKVLKAVYGNNGYVIIKYLGARNFTALGLADVYPIGDAANFITVTDFYPSEDDEIEVSVIINGHLQIEDEDESYNKDLDYIIIGRLAERLDGYCPYAIEDYSEISRGRVMVKFKIEHEF